MDDLDARAGQIAGGILAGAPFFEGLGDLTLADAFDLQDAVAERLAGPLGGRGGWKIAWNVPHLMEKFAMPHPGMGRVFKDHIRADGAEIQLADYQNLMIEAEIVARLSADIGPGRTHTKESVAAAVEGFTVGYEVLDRRASPADARAPAILAQNVFNAGAVHGATWVETGALDPGAIQTVMTDNDTIVVDGAAMAPQDPLEAIAFLANHYTARGETMNAGDIILCGSHIPLYPIENQTKLVLSMGELGAVTLVVS